MWVRVWDWGLADTCTTRNEDAEAHERDWPSNLTDTPHPIHQPKRIHKRDLTGPELRQFVLSYVEMFKSGTRFPEAQTMLEATASANNQNARQLAVAKYKAEMDAFVGPKVYEYRKVEHFLAHHRACKDGALRLFDTSANIGRRAQIKEFRAKVLEEVEDLFTRYEEANANRNPFRNFEYYALPLLVALVAFVLRWVSELESTCSLERRYMCKAVSHAMGHIYVFLVTFVLILSFNRIRLFVDYLQQVRIHVCVCLCLRLSVHGWMTTINHNTHTHTLPPNTQTQVVPVLIGMDRPQHQHLKTA